MQTESSRENSLSDIFEEGKCGLSRIKDRLKNKARGKRQKSLTTYFDCSALGEPKSEVEEFKERLAALDQEIENQKQKIPQKEQRLIQMRTRIVAQKLRAEEVMIKLLKRQYEDKRSSKQIENEYIGKFTFKDGGSSADFAPGSGYQSIIQERKQIMAEMERLKKEQKAKEERKEKVDRDALEMLEFKMSICKQSLTDAEEKIIHLNTDKEMERLRMKLAFKETKCYFAGLSWPVVNGRYQVLELIGTGGFGEVYRVIDLHNLQHYALKLSIPDPSEDFSQQSNFVKHLLREQEIHKKLEHKNIARLYDTIKLEDKNNVVVASILELCEGPDLHQYIKKHKNLEEKEARFVVKQVLSALYYMNHLDKKVIHYDLKPQNILMNGGIIKVIDFGLCKVMEPDQDHI